MVFRNPRFTIPGEFPGEASDWTLITHTSVELWAGLGPKPFYAWEDFERWSELWRNLDQIEIRLAVFDPLGETIEDFEEAWRNDIYHFELPLSRVIWAIFGSRQVDDFETGWDNDAYGWEWDAVASTIAFFGRNDYEGFEISWNENESYFWYWEDVLSIYARFDSGTRLFENFSGDWDEPKPGEE